MTLIWIQAKLLLNPTEKVSLSTVSGSLSVILPPSSDPAAITNALQSFSKNARPSEGTGELSLVLDALSNARDEHPEAPVAGILFWSSPAGPLPALGPNTRLDVVVVDDLTCSYSRPRICQPLTFVQSTLHLRETRPHSIWCLHLRSIGTPAIMTVLRSRLAFSTSPHCLTHPRMSQTSAPSISDFLTL
jgi:hypothetical protein